MAINDNATLVAKTARYYVAPVGTAAPADLKTIGAAWEEIGHTSPDDILAWATEGGDKTTLGSLQSPSLRTTTASKTESFSTTLLQWDEKTLPFYFGDNLELIPGSEIFVGVKSAPDAVKKALLVVIADGQNRFGVYAASTEIGRGDDLSLDSTEDLAGLPVNITLINYQGAAYAYAITPIGGVTP